MQAMDPLYLDHNATAPVWDAVIDAVSQTLRSTGNASSIHAHGRAARHAVERARDIVANAVGASSAHLTFSGGATESNNTVIRAFAAQKILVAATDHVSVVDAADNLVRIPVLSNGLIDEAAFATLLTEQKPALVSVMIANNETGVIQDIQKLANLAHRHGALFHADAVQALGRLPVDMKTMGIDIITLSAHKIGGPQGVGAHITRPGISMAPLLRGGGQERRQRAGTENIPGIVGFGVAAQQALQSMDRMHSTAILRDRLERSILAATPQAVIIGGAAPRLPNTLCFALPGFGSETALMGFDLEKISVSSGSACSSGTVKKSHVLAAMGLPDDIAAGSIRVSLTWSTTQSDIDRVIDVWQKITARRTA